MAYYNKKPLVSEREDKNPYVMYWPHTIPRIEVPPSTDDYIQVVSIDPGVVNCAIRIERRYLNGRIVPVYFELWKPCPRAKLEDNEPNMLYRNINDLLDSIKGHLLECHMAVIERQLAINYKSSRLMQSIITYFHIVLKDSPKYPIIYDVDPKLKGRMLECPPRCNGKELKDWAVLKAKELLRLRKDDWSLGVLDMYKKKADDLADTICQVEALFIYWNIEPITRPHIEPVVVPTVVFLPNSSTS